MSGIAAVFYRDGRPIERMDLNRIANSLHAYGPERRTVCTVGSVGCVYTHFTNCPEERTVAQPVSGGDGRFALLFDGRFDNRAEIATALGMQGERLMLMTDAALAMASWERWGEECVSHWVGEFAVIVCDKSNAELTALRDHFGARTLHYASNDDRFIIASAPKAIHAFGDLTREVDDQKIADALCQLYHDGERSFFRGIRRVPMGGILKADRSRTNTYRYYNLRDAVRPVRYKDDEDYVEAGLELLDQAVTSKMRSAQPVGAFLSGGLDSSSLSYFAARHLARKGKKLVTFTSVPEPEWDGRDLKGLFGNEGPYVKDIARFNPSIEVNLVDGAGLGHYHKQEELLLHLEMPVRNALNLQWTHAILEKAKSRGLGTMLQGTFGNATLTHLGDGVFGELLRQGAWRRLYQELAAISSSPRHFLSRTLRHLVFPMTPRWVWANYERLRGRAPDPDSWRRFGMISDAFASEMDSANRVAAAGYDYQDGQPGYSRAQWFNMIENWNTEIGDAMQGLRAMYGIEIRDPFADRRVVEWAFGVPEAQYHRNGVNRWLIRRMMADKLPKSVVENRKIGHQTADWHLRLSRDLHLIRRDLEVWKDDPDISRMVDLDFLSDLVANWPTQSLTNHKDDRFFQLSLTMPMALQIARFVQRENVRNFSSDNASTTQTNWDENLKTPS